MSDGANYWNAEAVLLAEENAALMHERQELRAILHRSSEQPIGTHTAEFDQQLPLLDAVRALVSENAELRERLKLAEAIVSRLTRFA